ncbi:MAG: radical SAM protein [Methylobacter sp.]|nr:radical SAM protein [Methylobacter sp.]
MLKYLIIKITGKCNLGCDYCYYMTDLAAQFRKRVKQETIFQIYQNYVDYARENALKQVTFCWHGGEPTLLGKDFFRSILAKQSDYFNGDIQVRNLIQSNGTLLDDEWAELFNRHNFSIGISIDGSPISHDSARPYHNGRGSYTDVVNSLRVLTKNNVRFGALTVIDPNLNGHDVFEHHYGLGIRGMDFLLPIFTKESFEEIYGHDAVIKFARFMCELFDAWVEKDDPSVSIGGLENLTRLVVGGKSNHCNTANKCDQYITIEPNGDVGICENARVIPNQNNNTVDTYLTKTNIHTHSFAEIEKAVAVNFATHEYNRRGETCLTCSVKDICNSGCSVHRYRSSENNFQNPSFFCDLYKTVISHIADFYQYEIGESKTGGVMV